MGRTEGRFRFLEAPNAFPFADIVTNTPEGPVFDLGVDLEMRDGVVYIKAEHVIEMAEQLGMASAVEVEDLRAEILGLTLAANRLPEKIERFTDGINALVRDYHDDLSFGDDYPSLSDFEKSSGQELGESKADNSDNVGQPNKSDEDSSSKSDNIDGQVFGFDFLKRPHDLPADSSDETKRASNSKG